MSGGPVRALRILSGAALIAVGGLWVAFVGLCSWTFFGMAQDRSGLIAFVLENSAPGLLLIVGGVLLLVLKGPKRHEH